ncbi:ataxin-10-like, partial [Mizuhopecten yessoensis]
MRSHPMLAEDKVILLRCCVQFLGNVVAGHTENSKLVWRQFSKSFRCLLCVEDEKLTQYVCMAIHSCIQGGGQDNDWSSRLGTDQDFLQIVCDILSAVTDTDLEWGIYVVEDAMRIKGVLEVIDQQQSEKQRIFALEVLLGELRNMSETRHLDSDPSGGVKAEGPCLETLQYLSKEVITKAYNILIVASQDTQMDSTPDL